MTPVCLDAYPTHPSFPSAREIGSTNTIASIVANTKNVNGIMRNFMEKLIDAIVWIAMFTGAVLIIPFFIAILHEALERWRKRK